MNARDRNLHIPVGPACNNNCAFCNEGPREERAMHNARFTPEVVEGVLRQHSRQLAKVILTSGEPTLNPSLPALIRMARTHGYRDVSLTTNGRMLSYARYCQELVRSGLTEVIISLHGHTAPLHLAHTRARGSFEQTVHGIENAARLRAHFPLRLVIATTLTRQNAPWFEAIVRFHRQFSPDESVFNVVQPTGPNMTRHFDHLMPRYEDVADVVEALFDTAPDLFFRDQRRIISVIDLPGCYAHRMAGFLGYGETRVVAGLRAEAGGGIGDRAQDVHEFVNNREFKTKREACAQCLYDAECAGVYSNYINRFGWDGSAPITRHPAASTPCPLQACTGGSDPR